jgi:ATP-dependent helicase HrpA
VPAPEVAAEAVAAMTPRSGPVEVVLGETLERLRGVPVPPAAFDTARLPPHLRMTFRVEDEAGRAVAAGKELGALREAVRPRLRSELAAATAKLERSGLTDWTIGSLPRTVALRGTGQAVRAYPALVDEGDSVAVRALESADAQAAAMRAGTRRLVLLASPSPGRHVERGLSNAARLTLSAAPHGSLAAVLDDATAAAADALIAEAGGPVWDEAGWARLRGHVAGALADRTAQVVADMVRVLDAARDVERRLDALTAVPLQPARADVREQLRRLVQPGFASAAGAARLPDVERYLRAAARRLERLPDATAQDRDRMSSVHELERAYRERLERQPRGRPLPDALREVPWMLEELRVSHFAQSLGTRGQVSAKRIRRALAV